MLRLAQPDSQEFALDLLGDLYGKTIVDLRNGDDLNSIPPGTADAVIAAGALRRSDPVRTARQIRRVLKPGGVAIFQERIAWSARVAAMKELSFADRGLTLSEVEAVCRAVGRTGRRRAFLLASRLKAAQRLDAVILRCLPFARKLASLLVWEARKES